MKYVICVTSGYFERFQKTAPSLKRSLYEYDIDAKVLFVVNMDSDVPLYERIANNFGAEVIPVHVDGRNPRWGNELELARFQVVSQYCDDDTFYWNADDDYYYNPHWLSFLKTVVEENPRVDYLTLLKWDAWDWRDFHNDYWLSGWRFQKVGLHMWGSFGMRWQAARPKLEKYFKDAGTDGAEFDVDFCCMLREEDSNFLYMPRDFSLVQHCNLISTVANQRGGALNHQYGEDFDPLMDPFKMRDK